MRGFRCPYSAPDEMIFREIKEMPGVKINGHKINNLRYGNDTVLLADNEADLQNIVETVKRENKRSGLLMNVNE